MKSRDTVKPEAISLNYAVYVGQSLHLEKCALIHSCWSFTCHVQSLSYWLFHIEVVNSRKISFLVNGCVQKPNKSPVTVNARKLNYQLLLKVIWQEIRIYKIRPHWLVRSAGLALRRLLPWAIFENPSSLTKVSIYRIKPWTPLILISSRSPDNEVTHGSAMNMGVPDCVHMESQSVKLLITLLFW